MTTRKELEEELRLARRQIAAAYWTFTRCARGKPPILEVPEAYDTVRRVTEELARRDAKRRWRRCVLLALLLFGCGGPPFTSLDLAAPDGGVASTGGQETVRDGSGGQSSPDGGGAPGSGGASSGGAGVDSGGAPGSGSVQSSGGSVASGGTTASGGSSAAGGAPGSGGAEAGGAGGAPATGGTAGSPGSGGASTGGSPDTGGTGGTDTGGSPGTGGSCSSCWCMYPGHTVLCAPTEFGFGCQGPAPDPLCHSVTFQGHEVFCCPKPSYP